MTEAEGCWLLLNDLKKSPPSKDGLFVGLTREAFEARYGFDPSRLEYIDPETILQKAPRGTSP